ncbi:MAG: hypothetical protein MJZ02_00025 [Paludibacteraceae bacterium]|nr:hypothetical protein [Paludibacteraceae bacterium]
MRCRYIAFIIILFLSSCAKEDYEAKTYLVEQKIDLELSNDSLMAKGLVVSPNGPFKSINEAVAKAVDGVTIYVLPGEYCDTVKAWGKTINIIGTDSAKCILYNATGDYKTPPIEMSSGHLKGLTIISKPCATLPAPTVKNYCLHIEDNYCYGHTFLIESVRFVCETSTPVGCGLRGNYSLSFKNCSFESLNSYPCTYIHDGIHKSVSGHADVLYSNCSFKMVSAIQPLSFKSHLEENTTTVTFINNKFDCPILNTNLQPVATKNAVEGTHDGWLGMMNWYLGIESMGNPVQILNY